MQLWPTVLVGVAYLPALLLRPATHVLPCSRFLDAVFDDARAAVVQELVATYGVMAYIVMAYIVMTQPLYRNW